MFILLAGIAVLVLGGEVFLRGAASLATRFHVPPLVVGLTVVAFGTSAPELVVSVQAVLSGSPDIAIGNIVGSNIANVLLVVGLPAILTPILAQAPTERFDSIFMPAATVIFLLLLYLGGGFNRFDGVLLIGLLALFLYVMVRRKDDSLAEQEVVQGPLLPTIGLLAAGGVMLPLGADWIVRGASDVAGRLGVPESVIALTIIAFGTSLPELVTVFIAALRKHVEMAIGNVVGSNIFNLLAVGGASTLVGLQQAPDQFWRYDFWVMLGSSVMITLMVLASMRIGRVFGSLMLAGYVAYMIGLARMNGLV